MTNPAQPDPAPPISTWRRPQIISEIARLREILASNRAYAQTRSEHIAKIEERIKVVDADNRSLEKQRDETRAQFLDLKARLLSAELANERLRGYLARVQEDDVVREDLVETGDPEGEKHLVPKRKSTTFNAPHHYDRGRHGQSVDETFMGGSGEPARKPRNWVNY